MIDDSPPDDGRQVSGPKKPRRVPEHQNVIGLMIGTALMFLGFLTVLLSISGGFEIDVKPILLYFGGLAIWANATVENVTVRYLVMGGAIIAGLAFFHFGEVLFWHKQVIFWATVLLVMYFMFKTSTPGE
jgi:hypothetical protein